MDGDGGGLAPKHPQQLIFENVSPATRLLEKRRQMYEVQDALETQKLRFAKDEEQFKKKEDTLRSRDLQLQHQLFRFNKFLQDNEAKRRRADTRAAEERAQIQQRDEEIKDLERQLEESRKQCAELEEEVSRNMKYEEFLEMVKDTCEDYSEIQDLVTRYETLEGANKDLMDIQNRSDIKIEEQKSEFQNYKKEREMEQLAFTNKINNLQSDLEDAGQRRTKLENDADIALQEDSRHSLHFGQLLMSVENLYLRCVTKRGGILQHAQAIMSEEGNKKDEEADEKEGEDSFKKKQQQAILQLRVILDYLNSFKEIVETLKRETKKDAKKADRNVFMEQPKMPEVKFDTREAEPRDGKGGNSGSQGNTRELSRRPGDTTGGSGGASGTDAPQKATE